MLLSRFTANKSHAFIIELLEERRLLAAHGFGPTATEIGQNLAVQNYPTINGSGETIAILDTGVDYDDPYLGDGVGKHYKVIGGWNFVDNNDDFTDDNGHGTGVAGIIGASQYDVGKHYYQGIAPGAKIVSVLIDDGIDNPDSTIINEGLQWVLDHRAEYNIVSVNLSEGGDITYSSKTTGANSTLLSELNAAGVFVAVAAGNDSTPDGVEYPGADPNAISVGAVDPYGNVASFSDGGPALDLLAPGEDVPLTYLDNDTLQPVLLTGSGTSFSTPAVAAAAALVKQADPALTPDEILTVLQASGTPILDTRSGDTYTLININNAIDKALHKARNNDVRSDNAEAKTQVTPGPQIFAQTAISPMTWLDSSSASLGTSGQILG